MMDMDDLALVRTLEGKQSAVFTAQQMAVVMGAGAEAASVKLNRMVRKGVLVRLMRGRYALPSADALAVASGMYVPSYVSLLAAFERHGTTTQSPRVIDIVNPVHSGKMQVELESGRFVLRFIRVDPSLMYGYEKAYAGNAVVFLATKERAIVDAVLFPGYVPLDEAAACIRSGIDRNKAVEYAKRTGRQAVMKRLGYLLSASGIPCSPEEFGVLSDNYVRLDPKLPRRGTYDSIWRVIVNRVVE